jgi:EAL domain-containing protein (putative c-di-GMP-specific phosphodiesterase class I)
MSYGLVISPRDENADEDAAPPSNRRPSGRPVSSTSNACAAVVRRALDEGRMELDCQPIFPASGGEPASFELLIRMRLETGERLPPSAFLSAAENAGLMPRIDRWVLNEATQWLRANPLTLPPDCTLSVNVSADALVEPDFARYVDHLLLDAGVPGERICLEITESMAITDTKRTARFLAQLRARGITVALDDFGTGYSSFGHLSALPADHLKIDGTFVLGMLDRNVDAAIVRSIIDLGHSLDMRVVAEYVEDDARLDVLRDMGVDYLQGYALGLPLPLCALA